MKKYLLPFVFITLIITALVYINAGGFEDVQISQKTSESRYIIGKSFEGNVKDEAFSNLFIEIEELKSSEKYDGHLGAVYYNNPANAKGNIKAFLGVIVNNEASNIPSGIEMIELNSTEIVEGKVTASNVFGISVNKVYNAIFDFAEKNSLNLDEHYIEWFPSKEEVVVQIRLKNE